MKTLTFRLTEDETFEAKLFRSHHKRQGCKVRGFLGTIHRVQKTEPTFSYIFEQSSSNEKIHKYIKCNNCQEQVEITAEKSEI